MDRRAFISGSAALAGSAIGAGAAIAAERSTATPVKAPRQQASFGQAGPNFPKVGGNLANQNYSSLTRITRANARRLGGAWHVNLGGGDTSQGQQSTIVAQNGLLYVQTTPAERVRGRWQDRRDPVEDQRRQADHQHARGGGRRRAGVLHVRR